MRGSEPYCGRANQYFFHTNQKQLGWLERVVSQQKREGS